MTSRRHSLLFAPSLAIALLGLAAAAHAAPKMYSGTIRVHTFGNSLTTARANGTGYTRCGFQMTSTCPPGGTNTKGSMCGAGTSFATRSYYELPLGRYHNGALTGTGPLGKSLGMGDPAATCGDLPVPPYFPGAPLLGTGIASTFSKGLLPTPGGGSSVQTVAPPAIRFTSMNAQDLARTTRGSFGFRHPYVFRATTATVYNGTGVLFPGGGPGALTAKVFPGIAAKAWITQGPNRFGGTLRLLGSMKQYSYYLNKSAVLTIGYTNWLWSVIGGEISNYATYSTPPFNTVWGYSSFYTGLVRAAGWPWTTGMVTVSARLGWLDTVLWRTGYDNRSPGGAGRIQLVTPKLTRWPYRSALARETGEIGILTLDFVPAPSSWLLLAAGAGLLGALHRWRTRR